MKFIKSLFSNRSKTVSLEDKIQALDKAPQLSLEEMVIVDTTDADELKLKVAALQRLHYCPALLQCSNSSVPALKKTARLRLAELINSKDLELSILQKDLNNVDTVLDISSYVRDNNIQNIILEGIFDQQTLADICTQSQSSNVRKILAERIDNIDLLRSLSKILQNKDKIACRIIKEKIAINKEKNDGLDNAKKEILILCDEMEFHSAHAYDKVYPFRFRILLQRWSDIKNIKGIISEENHRRFHEASGICEQRIHDLEKKDLEKKEYDKKSSTADKERELLLEKLWLQINSIYEDEDLTYSTKEAIYKNKEDLTLQWNALSHYRTASKKQDALYVSLCESIDSLATLLLDNNAKQALHRIKHTEGLHDAEDIHLLRQSLDTIKHITDFSASKQLSQYKKILAEFDKKYKEENIFKEKQSQITLSLIHQSLQAISQGKVNKALAIRHSIDKKLDLIENSSSKITTQLSTLDKSIEKLLDWQNYAVLPKKESLIIAMRELIDTNLSPDSLSIKIKNLQNEWKELRQNGEDRNEKLWEQFSQLADAAYAPCKIYYQELSDERQHNLKNKKEVIQQLNTYINGNDWGNINCRQVEGTLQTARKEFYSYTPIGRKENKLTSLDFNKSVQAIQDKLNEKYTENKNYKKQLIQQAETLIDNEDIDEAINGAKKLQAQWKKTKVCDHKEEQKLWREFHKNCEAIFTKKSSFVAAQAEERSNNLSAAQALITKIDSYLTLSGEEFLVTQEKFQNNKEEFSTLGELPDHDKHEISRIFSKKIAQFEERKTLIKNEINQQSWKHFFSLVEKINHYQHTALSLNENMEDTLQELSVSIKKGEHWPNGTQEALNNKIQQDFKKEHHDENTHIEQLRILCIRAEIGSDISSPSSDKELRMKHQINLLQQGISGSLQTKDTTKTIGVEWATIGPVETNTYHTLLERFCNAWIKLK